MWQSNQEHMSVLLNLLSTKLHARKIEDTRLESCPSLEFIKGTNWFGSEHVRKTNSDLIFFVLWSLVQKGFGSVDLPYDIFVGKTQISLRREKATTQTFTIDSGQGARLRTKPCFSLVLFRLYVIYFTIFL